MKGRVVTSGQWSQTVKNNAFWGFKISSYVHKHLESVQKRISKDYFKLLQFLKWFLQGHAQSLEMTQQLELPRALLHNHMKKSILIITVHQ